MFIPKPTSVRQLAAVDRITFKEEPTSIRQLYQAGWFGFQDDKPTSIRQLYQAGWFPFTEEPISLPSR